MGNASVTTGNPTVALRQALNDLLASASFRFDRKTRDLIKEAERALRAAPTVVAHERPVGIFIYNNSEHAFQQVDEEQAKDAKGNLRNGCEYFFRQPISLVV